MLINIAAYILSILCIYTIYEIYIVLYYTKYNNTKLPGYNRICCSTCNKNLVYDGYKYYQNTRRNVYFGCINCLSMMNILSLSTILFGNATIKI